MKTIEDKIKFILSGDYQKEPFEFNFLDFKEFYTHLVKQNNNLNPDVVIVNLERTVFIIFPDFSRQEILISSKKFLIEDDFDFILQKKYYGAQSPRKKFTNFFWGELQIKPLRTIFIFILFFLIIFFIPRDFNLFMEFIVPILLQISTLFFSVFLLFTISQNEKISSDPLLFKIGFFHQFANDDQNITILASANIFSNLILSALIFYFPNTQIYSKIIFSIFVSLSITMLLNTFFIISEYYLNRTNDLNERDHKIGVFDLEFNSKRKKMD